MISGLRHKAFRAGLIMIIKELKEPVIKEVKKKEGMTVMMTIQWRIWIQRDRNYVRNKIDENTRLLFTIANKKFTKGLNELISARKRKNQQTWRYVNNNYTIQKTERGKSRTQRNVGQCEAHQCKCNGHHRRGEEEGAWST